MLQGCVGVTVAGEVVAAAGAGVPVETGAGVPVETGADVLDATGAKVVLAGAVVGREDTAGASVCWTAEGAMLEGTTAVGKTSTVGNSGNADGVTVPGPAWLVGASVTGTKVEGGAVILVVGVRVVEETGDSVATLGVGSPVVGGAVILAVGESVVDETGDVVTALGVGALVTGISTDGASDSLPPGAKVGNAPPAVVGFAVG